jgi:hypothetical protein
MRKFTALFILILASFTSCNLDDDGIIDFYTEFLPIESVDVPDYFVYGETYNISMTFVKPSSCHVFRDFFYVVNGNERIVAIENTVYLRNNCDETPESVTVSFEFPVNRTETYVFKFYLGKNDEGVDQYQIVEIPVVE